MTFTMPHQLPAPRRRFRRLIERLIFLLMAVVVLQSWYLEGLLIPCLVTGGSMAPALLGTHREVTCGDCGHRFVCGSDLQPVGVRVSPPSTERNRRATIPRPEDGPLR